MKTNNPFETEVLHLINEQVKEVIEREAKKAAEETYRRVKSEFGRVVAHISKSIDFKYGNDNITFTLRFDESPKV